MSRKSGNSANWTVYALKDPRTGAVRYVGVTFNLLNRRRTHERDCEVARTPHRKWLLDLGASGLIPTLEVLETGQGNWGKAEMNWVASLRIGGSDLTNSTTGGPGVRGRKQTPEQKKKKQESQTGQKRSPEFCEKMREISHHRAPGFYEALAARNRANAKPRSLESRAKQSASRRGKPWTPAQRAARIKSGVSQPRKGTRKLVDIAAFSDRLHDVLMRWCRAHTIDLVEESHPGFIRYFVKAEDLCCAQSVLPALAQIAQGGPHAA